MNGEYALMLLKKWRDTPAVLSWILHKQSGIPLFFETDTARREYRELRRLLELSTVDKRAL